MTRDLFTAAVTTLLEVEGGYVDHPSDPGGRTNWGISQRAYPNLDIRSLTRAEAISIYRRDYWNKIPDTLPDDVRFFLFDASVNHGVARALEWAGKYDTLTDLVAARLRFYANLGTFNAFGRGWTRRVAHVLDAISDWQDAEPGEGGISGRARTLVLTNLSVADRWLALARNPVLRGSFVWRVRGDRVDVRRE